MLLASILFVSCLISAQASVNDYFSKADQEAFLPGVMKAFVNLSRGDVSTVYYGARGFEILKDPLPLVVKLNTCAHLEANFKDTLSPEAIFHALSTWGLFNCADTLNKQGLKLHKDSTIKAMKDVLDKKGSIPADIRYALEVLQLLGQSISGAAKIASALKDLVKEDDSLQNVGHTLHACSFLGEEGKVGLNLVEDIVVQADEIGGRMLQWEGGLSVTSLILTGLLRLAGPKPFSQVQSDKFATYLLSRKTVQSPKGILALLDATIALSKSGVSPISITFVDSPRVSLDDPNLKLRISNILGEPLKPTPSPIVAQSATRIADDVVVLSKQQLASTSNPIEYVLALRLEPGQYRVGVSIGTHSAALIVRVLGPVKLQWLEAGLGDQDGTTAPKLLKLQHPEKLPSPLQADSSQHLIVKFSLSRPVHQPFVRLSSGKREIIFVAEQDSSKVYKIDVNLASELSHSAVFDMELILGDSVMSNPLQWTFGQVDVKLGTPETKQSIIRGPQPEIKHMFRPAEKRPPQVVSMLFTALAAAPLLLLLIMWLRVGVSLTNFNLAAIAFHIGLAGIFGLFTCFWLKLDMFTTCAWLLPFGGFTFLAGHQVLSKLARQKK